MNAERNRIVEIACGAFVPSKVPENWVHDFVKANVEGLCARIVPGEQVQFISHDSIFQNPDGDQHNWIDYVPVVSGDPVHTGGVGHVSTSRLVHHFIIRPSNIVVDQRATGRPDMPLVVLTTVLVLWSFIGSAVRALVHRKDGSGMLIPLPFEALKGLGAFHKNIPNVIADCERFCEYRNLAGMEKLLYIDLGVIGALVSAKVHEFAAAAAKGERDSNGLLDYVAKYVTLNSWYRL